MATLEQRPGGRPPQRRSFGRKFLRFVVTLLVMLAALGGSGFLVYSSWLRSQEPYTTALKLAKQDPKLIEKLGQPIKEVLWIPTVRHSDENKVTIIFSLAGPNGAASITADAHREKDGWCVKSLTATPNDGTSKITLEDNSESGENVAPVFRQGSPAPAGPKGPAASTSKSSAASPDGPNSLAPSKTLDFDLPQDLPQEKSASPPSR